MMAGPFGNVLIACDCTRMIMRAVGKSHDMECQRKHYCGIIIDVATEGVAKVKGE
jgi:hypothetical protein